MVESVIDHHISGIHHVLEWLGLSIYDYLILLSGVVFIIAGLWPIRSGKKDTVADHLPSAYK